jgi:hypothetical protein
MTKIDPVFIRPADGPRYGVCRSTIYNWLADGVLKSKVIRRPGSKRGVRLIEVESLRAYIESCPEK